MLVLYGEQFSAIHGEACDWLPPVAVANSDHCLGDIIHIRVVSDNMHPTQDNVITVGRFFFFCYKITSPFVTRTCVVVVSHWCCGFL